MQQPWEIEDEAASIFLPNIDDLIKESLPLSPKRDNIWAAPEPLNRSEDFEKKRKIAAEWSKFVRDLDAEEYLPAILEALEVCSATNVSLIDIDLAELSFALSETDCPESLRRVLIRRLHGMKHSSEHSLVKKDASQIKHFREFSPTKQVPGRESLGIASENLDILEQLDDESSREQMIETTVQNMVTEEGSEIDGMSPINDVIHSEVVDLVQTDVQSIEGCHIQKLAASTESSPESDAKTNEIVPDDENIKDPPNVSNVPIDLSIEIIASSSFENQATEKAEVSLKEEENMKENLRTASSVIPSVLDPVIPNKDNLLFKGFNRNINEILSALTNSFRKKDRNDKLDQVSTAALNETTATIEEDDGIDKISKRKRRKKKRPSKIVDSDDHVTGLLVAESVPSNIVDNWPIFVDYARTWPSYLTECIISGHKLASSCDRDAKWILGFIFFFPEIVRYTIGVFAPSWASVCLFYAFLIQVLCTGNEDVFGERKISFFRKAIPLAFLLDGVSHPSLLLGFDRYELLITAHMLMSIKCVPYPNSVSLISFAWQIIFPLIARDCLCHSSTACNASFLYLQAVLGLCCIKLSQR